jgi:hypothetical protein
MWNGWLNKIIEAMIRDSFLLLLLLEANLLLASWILIVGNFWCFKRAFFLLLRRVYLTWSLINLSSNINYQKLKHKSIWMNLPKFINQLTLINTLIILNTLTKDSN